MLHQAVMVLHASAAENLFVAEFADCLHGFYRCACIASDDKNLLVLIRNPAGDPFDGIERDIDAAGDVAFFEVILPADVEKNGIRFR